MRAVFAAHGPAAQFLTPDLKQVWHQTNLLCQTLSISECPLALSLSALTGLAAVKKSFLQAFRYGDGLFIRWLASRKHSDIVL